MFKRFRQFVLSKYPLLWNTRFYVLIPIALGINLLYFLSGYQGDVTIHDINRWDSDIDFPQIQFTVLLSTLLIIFWLVYYLRNNAFKSFYPLKEGYLFKEFLIIFFTFLSCSSFIYSYNLGYFSSLKQNVASTDVEKEIETYSLAQSFLAFQSESALFLHYNNCDSLKRRGSVYLNETSAPDVGKAPYETEQEKVYLYSNYCASNQFIPDCWECNLAYQRAISQRTKSWIRNKNRDSIAYILREAEKLQKKYGGHSNLDINRIVEDCMDDTVSQFISDYTELKGLDYFEPYPIRSGLQTMLAARNNRYKPDEDALIIYLYFLLHAAMLLFTYRITSRRTWFIGLISLGVVAIFFSLIGAASRSLDFIFFLYVFLWAGSLVVALVNIFNEGDKRIGGVGLLWFSWLLASIPVYFALWLEERHVYDDGYEHTRQWIRDNMNTIHYGTIIMTILVTGLLIIPLARKWQACPQE